MKIQDQILKSLPIFDYDVIGHKKFIFKNLLFGQKLN